MHTYNCKPTFAPPSIINSYIYIYFLCRFDTPHPIRNLITTQDWLNAKPMMLQPFSLPISKRHWSCPHGKTMSFTKSDSVVSEAFHLIGSHLSRDLWICTLHRSNLPRVLTCIDIIYRQMERKNARDLEFLWRKWVLVSFFFGKFRLLLIIILIGSSGVTYIGQKNLYRII